MKEEYRSRWIPIRDFPLDDPQASFSFTDRLARENGWDLPYAIRAVNEYKKFMFLISLGKGPLTPSDQVDQVWHLHLLYTQSYWEEFREVLGTTIHHGPTKGGGEEKAKYDDLYGRTFDAYREIFEKEPAADLWPPHHIRFGEIVFTRINRHRNWVLPKPKWIGALLKKMRVKPVM